ncbi:MAG: hypothetical protein FJZ12_01060 [Candidatus Omnitrophica bacterium]|nr:hypothetical protein [Candidatus Omnitrophota bacterium]
MSEHKYLNEEQRRYIRLDTVLPVQIRLESLDGSRFISEWLQGFTNNISSGGICLCINNLDPRLADIVEKRQARVSLEIELPIVKNPINAIARISWVNKAHGVANKYFIGLCYEVIDKKKNNSIIRYARVKKILVPIGLGVVVFLSLFVTINSLINFRLTQDNKILVKRLVTVLQDSKAAKQNIEQISREKEEFITQIEGLKLRIADAEAEKSRLQYEDKIGLKEYSEKFEKLNNIIYTLSQEKNALDEQLASVKRKEVAVKEELLYLDKTKAILEKANVDKMFKWVKTHQNSSTGLVVSFEGDRDMKEWAFIYDQSLAAQAYTYYSDLPRVTKILDFFMNRAKRKDGLFLNAYYVKDGEPAEYAVHSGPNIWLGIAILQYTHKTMDLKYLGLAEEIAQRLIDLQNQDKDGGIRGGPSLTWFSTEHNLDAYAFFNMLYSITGQKRYMNSADKILYWLSEHTYNKPDAPIKRGKGDSTIATDTYAWSIAAIGPAQLEKMGMNPHKIIEFAEENCAVEVEYMRPEGSRIKIRGFDFAPERHVGRGGVISSEWTAQMIVALKIMEEFSFKKGMPDQAEKYKLKAEEYLSSLNSMIISSPSPSGQGETCLPYATQDFVDTGHGWLTPKGKSTGSLAGTIYTIFAYYNYNPLALKSEK